MYYHTVAKDFETNFVHMQVTIDHPEDEDRLYFLNAEPVDELPAGILTGEQSVNLTNVMLFKIDLNLSELKDDKDRLMKKG